MRKSIHTSNKQMLTAYNLYTNCSYSEALSMFENILSQTTSIELRKNLTCTISTISLAMGNYNYALDILESNQNQEGGDGNGLVEVRVLGNMCFLRLIMGHYMEAMQTYQKLKNTIKMGTSKKQMLQFVLKLFFRIHTLSDLSQKTIITNDANIIQAFYYLNIGLAKQICGFEGTELLKTAYQIFVNHNKMELAVVCLRELLLLPLDKKESQKYEKQICKIMAINHMSQYELDHMDVYQCCKTIALDLVDFVRQQEKFLKKGLGKQNGLWKIVLNYESRKLMNNASLCEEQKTAIFQNIEMMLQEKSQLVIFQMKKTDFYTSAEREIEEIIASLTQIFQRFAKDSIAQYFKVLKNIKFKQGIKNRNHSYVNLRNGDGNQKQNRVPVSMIRDRSCKSLRSNQSRTKISIIKPNNNDKDVSRFIFKVLKFCQYGTFLSKRNYNSDGGEYRFVRVTQSLIKWAKNPEKIQENCQVYPLKDITSIVYGKCTQTLLKPSNQLLKQQFCFSLKLQKRTLDFYCKDFQQAANWVCGLSYKLKQINPNFRGYSLGRMLWKKMFMLLRENFTNKIRRHERKFYYETAQAIILFGKNGCILPSK